MMVGGYVLEVESTLSMEGLDVRVERKRNEDNSWDTLSEQ